MLTTVFDGLKLAMFPFVGEGRRLPRDRLGDSLVRLEDDLAGAAQSGLERVAGLVEPPVYIGIPVHP